MSKAVLVMDMPSSCMGCNFLYCEIEENKEYCEAREIRKQIHLEKEEKPDWCPLKPMPEKKEEKQYCGNGVFGINTAMETRFNQGYNACIDELLNREER